MTNLCFEHVPITDNNDPMVDITEYPFLSVPVYYQQGLSDTPKLYTRRAIAEKLVALQQTTLVGYQFKIWDPWRPRSVQGNIYHKYWQELHAKHPDWDDPRLTHEVGLFVTSPDTPSRIPPHATGGSIDLTLVDRSTGQELNMGTAFDHFGPEAGRDYFEIAARDETVRHNRRLLYSAMTHMGFSTDPDEWWHFDYGNQKWAVSLNKDTAIYGEIVSIEPVKR